MYKVEKNFLERNFPLFFQMLRRIVPKRASSVLPSHQSMGWLDSNGYARLCQSDEVRRTVTGGGIADSLLADIGEAERRAAQLSRDLMDKSMSDLRELIETDIQSESELIAQKSDHIRQLILAEMDRAEYLEEDKLDARIEVRAGVGGDEALKWAQEVFAMYEQVSQRLGWSIDVTDQGDVMKAIVTRGSSDYSPFGFLRFESGVHRVQRVPFNSDRMQTSAAAVYIVPKIEVARVVIRDADLKVHISKKSSGAGGQSVNAAYQQVRMTHVPSGFTVVVNDSHAQQENRETALRLIHEKVQLMEEEKALVKMASARKGQVRTADRSEKVRSYNFQRHEVNDHRLTANNGGVVKESCEDFMTDCGSLVDLWAILKFRRENELINHFICAAGR